MAAALRNGIPYHFPDPVGRRVQRVALLFFDEGDAGSRSHLKDRGFAVLQNAVDRGDRRAERPCDAHLLQGAPHTYGERLHRALAAVRERPHQDFCAAVRPENSGADCIARLKRTERTFEGINGDYYFHLFSSLPHFLRSVTAGAVSYD